MDPFGILAAISTSVEAVGDLLNPKKPKETETQRIGFLIFYASFLIGGIVPIIAIFRSLYLK
jgi:hypothetical protein